MHVTNGPQESHFTLCDKKIDIELDSEYMHYKARGQDWTCSVTSLKTEFPAVRNNHRPHLREQN